MDIQHPDINRIERLGYPNPEYLEYELRLEREDIVVENDYWPDGLTWEEWQKEKRASIKTGVDFITCGEG